MVFSFAVANWMSYRDRASLNMVFPWSTGMQALWDTPMLREGLRVARRTKRDALKRKTVGRERCGVCWVSAGTKRGNEASRLLQCRSGARHDRCSPACRAID